MDLLLLQIETEAARLQVLLIERGLSEERAWKISHLETERG